MDRKTILMWIEIIGIFKNIPRKKMNLIITSGLLKIFRDGNIEDVPVDEIKKAIGFDPIAQKAPRHKATMVQLGMVMEIFKNTSHERMEAIITTGLFTMLRDGDIEGIDRGEVRRMFGLSPLIKKVPKSKAAENVDLESE